MSYHTNIPLSSDSAGTSFQRGGYQIAPGTAFGTAKSKRQYVPQFSIQGQSGSASLSPENDLQRNIASCNGGSAFSERGQKRMSVYRQQRLANASGQGITLPIYPLRYASSVNTTENEHKGYEVDQYQHCNGKVNNSSKYSDQDPVICETGYDYLPHEPPEEIETYHQDYSNASTRPTSHDNIPQQHYFSSSTALATAAAAPALASLDFRSHNNLPSNAGSSVGPSNDLPVSSSFHNYPTSLETPSRNTLGVIDPADIEDDDEDPFQESKQRGKIRNKLRSSAAVGGSGTAVTATGPAGFLKGLGSRNTSGAYGQVPGYSAEQGEKSEWLDHQTRGNKRLKWTVASLIILVILLAVLGGVIGAVITSKKSSSSNSGSNLNRDSPQIQSLLGNQNLHKVFPGIDYTPLNAQYPACLSEPPNQDNITQDLAVLSQLTPSIRLYGTDCNQTEMVLNAISALNMNESIKVWLGVWLENNQTTNTRQLDQMYSLLEKYSTSSFAGIIIGNEVLFRKDMTEQQLIDTLNDARAQLKSQNINLPIATSDLGSSWTLSLVEAVDIVMSNVHPFFGGVPASEAAIWTWSYWQENDVVLTKGMANKQSLIAETGWPSGGGNDCGTDNTCTTSTAGSVAGINEMNTFLSGWVCDALTNATQYFWFEAFDEPWKAIYNTPTEQWEDKWGIMDVNRNLKTGLKIPDCGGKTANLSS